MKNPLILATGAALVLSACSSVQPTPAYKHATSLPRTRDDAAFSASLHESLALAGIAHKVVTFEYESDSRFAGAIPRQRTAIIYRDTAREDFPWWLITGDMAKPFWLPNETTDRQVRFFARHETRVIEEKYYDTDAGKNVKPLRDPARREAISRIQPAPDAPAPVSVKKPEPAPKAAPVGVTKLQPAPKAAKPRRIKATPKPEVKKPDPTPQAVIIEEPPVKKERPALITKETPQPVAKPKSRQPLITKPEEKPAPAAKPKSRQPLIQVPDEKAEPKNLGDPAPLPKTGEAKPGFWRRLFARL